MLSNKLNQAETIMLLVLVVKMVLINLCHQLGSLGAENTLEALGVDTPLSMSKSNQDFVAEFKIQQWLDQGLTPQQIAAKVELWKRGRLGKQGWSK